jgi:hypothetical protein
MKRLSLVLPLSLLVIRLLPAEGIPYRLEYRIRGSAVSRMLFVFPLRVYYEASAAVDLTAVNREDGSTCFAYAGIPGNAYVLRTLGFSGKTLALLTAGALADEDDSGAFADDILSNWRAQTPEFSARIKAVKKFPHRLLAAGPQSFSFERDASGFYRDFKVELEPRYRYHPARTGIYFNVFPMLAELLTLLNNRFVPEDHKNGALADLPDEWEGDDLDFSADLNRVAKLMEKAFKSLVTVKQKAAFRLRFRVTSKNAGEIAICGEDYADVPLWKGFMIREVVRKVQVRPNGREILADEFRMEIRNNKGQGGFVHLLLRRIDFEEDNR